MKNSGNWQTGEPNTHFNELYKQTFQPKSKTIIETNTALQTKEFVLSDVDLIHFFGVNNAHLNYLEKYFPKADIIARGDLLKVKASKIEIDAITKVVSDMVDAIQRKGKLTMPDVDTIIHIHSLPKTENNEYEPTENEIPIVHTYSGETVVAKTSGQKSIVHAVANNDIVFAIGPAGTGKTYTSVALAVKALKERKVKKIILARPAVEAGENLGFLPGDLKEKIDPYLRPLYDALEDMIEHDKLEVHLAKNIIEIAPLAYMRGRTLNNAFVILDEAQNASNTQMKMFLTRIGFNSQAIITGDITQTDLPKKQESGLVSIQNILKNIDGIDFVYLDQNDVVRHKLVRDIIAAYERHDSASATDQKK